MADWEAWAWSSCYGSFDARQYDSEYSSVLTCARCCEAPVMGLDDRFADRQSQAHSVRLRAEEGVEQLAHVRGVNSRTGIIHHDQDCAGVGWLGSDAQHARTIRDRLHCVDRIGNKIDHDLPKLNLVPVDLKRPGLIELQCDDDIVLLHVPRDQRESFPNQIAGIDCCARLDITP